MQKFDKKNRIVVITSCGVEVSMGKTRDSKRPIEVDI